MTDSEKLQLLFDRVQLSEAVNRYPVTIDTRYWKGFRAIFTDEIDARNRVAARYQELLDEFVTVPKIPIGLTSVWAQYTVRLPIGRDRDTVAAKLKAAGVPTAAYYAKPLHSQSAYRDYPVAGNGLPVSDRLACEVLSLPIHPYLDEGTQDRIVEALGAELRD